ncbi:ExbD/TolR family protein [Pararhodobacter zhoushanensis]|uniref:Biopolymer transporter ExbD n=1 Tax=Pararhodobacter zhoushanensis TaxID=2479545 RepID=A0ABT3GWW5_9RHOB|nr:biopolymer transporter ExbD [Pararhodobacter zhoushanensis]MCW1932033.1 biopolymer transporter ExbD [Pararhodobacter zhoushanensis]
MPSLVPPVRRANLSLTSLIDVIFLLLLFFMLTSTFTKLGELELSAGTPGGSATEPPLFVQLAPESLAVNTEPVALDALRARLDGTEGLVLVSLAEGVTAQRLVDVLAVLRGAELNLQVLP